MQIRGYEPKSQDYKTSIFSTLHVSKDDRERSLQTGITVGVVSAQKSLCVVAGPERKAPSSCLFSMVSLP